ncbi:MAG: hemolysin family protein [Verrucomicrobiota bacterium]|nr:hemolysin family protein [Verrucomicrobiota bacterium]
MNAAILIEGVALTLLLVCSAFCSGSETAIFAMNPLRIRRIGRTHPAAARRIEKILATPTSFLSSILIGNTLVNIAASAIGYRIAEHFCPARGEIVAIPAMTLLLVLFGEVAPKRFAMRNAERLARLYSGILVAFIAGMTPARTLLEKAAGLVRKNARAADRSLTEDEFLTVVELGEEEGVLAAEQRNMVDGIIGLERVQAGAVMTPRVDLVGIDLNDPPANRETIARGVQFRYLPVYRKSIDHPEGFLDVPRFLLSPDRNFDAALVAASFVPQTATLCSLLAMFQKEQRHAVFVMDEYGGTAGMVTMGDILEEVVGDVEKEYGVEKLTIQKMAENHWIVDGSTSLADINGELDVSLHAEGADRIAGWIGARTNYIPHTGEVIEAQGCRVTVHRTRKNRVVTVFIEKLAAPLQESESGNDIV